MKKGYKVVLLLALSLLLLLTACSRNGGTANDKQEGSANSPTPSQTSKKEVVLTIPHYKTGQNVGGKFFLPQVERFNAKYAGQYKIKIEEVPQDNYKDKIKLLFQTGALPALVEGGDTKFIETLIEKDLIYDLKPWLDSKPELKKQLIADSVSYNTRNGKILTMPFSVIRPIGLFYNKEMFEKAGITKPIAQMSFTEFDAAIEAIEGCRLYSAVSHDRRECLDDHAAGFRFHGE